MVRSTVALSLSLFSPCTVTGVRFLGSKLTSPHSAFELVSVNEVDEQDTEFTLYRHIKTGAEVLSAVNDDDNKVFAVGFRTPVNDSTGVAHILEHSVLCGSDKYPVKEPFVHLMRTSMQTYLNAYTYPERTIYPVASQNLKDFYNLMDVYLDAVFHPRAVNDPQVLAQEGWHYEITNPKDPLAYKGIVYNEMKGVYGSADSRIGEASKSHLFPDTTYRFNSGGDPKDITALTFDGFKSFYDRHYHPSNSRVFFYGNDPVEARLEKLDAYLSEFGAPSTPAEQTRVATQKMWSSPRDVKVSFPVAADASPEEQKHMIAMEWLLSEEEMTSFDIFSLNLVSHLLLGTSSSVLHKALTESLLGEKVTGGFSDGMKQPTFSVGLKGVSAENVGKVSALVDKTLHDVVTSGFQKEAVEASLNSIEFYLREFSSASATRGISYLNAAMKNWVFERDPLKDLRFEEDLKKLKAELAKPDQHHLEDFVRTYLLDNKHRLTVEGVPDPTLAETEEENEQAKLVKAKHGMNQATLERLVEEAKELKAAQESPDTPANVAKLPTLSLSDLDRKVKDLDINVHDLAGTTYLTHAVASSGIIYADVVFDASVLTLEDVPLLPLFEYLMLNTGTSKMDRTTFEQQLGARTGGISTSVLKMLPKEKGDSVSNPDDMVFRLMMHGKATVTQVDDMFELMKDALTDANLDSQDRALEFLKQQKSSYENALRSSGNHFAQTRIFARRSLAGYIDEITGGLTYFGTVKKLLETAQEDWPSLHKRLARMGAVLIDRQSAVMNVAADKKSLTKVEGSVETFVKSLPLRLALVDEGETVRAAKHKTLRLEAVEEGFSVPTQVNFVAKGGGLFEQGEKLSGAYQVVVRYLSNSYMWDNVRVVGGAYGASCSLSSFSGTFLCSSYRDPNLEVTLETYDGIADYLDGLKLDDAAIEQLIIGAVADYDKPMAPASQGTVSMTRYLSGQTLASRQKWRDDMFSTSAQDFKDFAKKLRAKSTSFHACVFGEEEALTKANTVLTGPRKLSISDA